MGDRSSARGQKFQVHTGNFKIWMQSGSWTLGGRYYITDFLIYLNHHLKSKRMTKTAKPKSHAEYIQQQVKSIYMKLKSGKRHQKLWDLHEISICAGGCIQKQWAFEGLEYLRTVTVYSLDNMIANLKRESENGKGLAQSTNEWVWGKFWKRMEQSESYKFLKPTYQPKLHSRIGLFPSKAVGFGTKIEQGRDNRDRKERST